MTTRALWIDPLYAFRPGFFEAWTTLVVLVPMEPHPRVEARREARS